MPVNKSAFLRYRIIDGCLTNTLHKYPSLHYIIEKIEEQLDVSLSASMFSKDLQQMKATYNAPIKFDKYHKGYYYTEPSFSIKEFPLTHNEIEALDMSTALLQQLKGTRIFQHFENAINKVIEGYRLSDILGQSQTQILQVEEPVRQDSSQWLEIILKAIVDKQCLDITYKSYEGSPKVHRFSGYLLKEYRNRWYVIGHSNLHNTVLILALDRIVTVVFSKSPYHTDASFLPANFFKFSLGITQLHNATAEQVILSFTPKQAKYILSQPLHHSQQILLQNDEELQVSLLLYLTTELTMSILSYGNAVRVLAPKSLQNSIKNEIKKMAALY